MRTQACNINRPYKGHTARINLLETISRYTGTPSRCIQICIFDNENTIVDYFEEYTQGFTVKRLRRYAKALAYAKIDLLTA